MSRPATSSNGRYVRQPEVPPNDPDAEAACLNCVLTDPRTIPVLAEILRPSDFYSAYNGHAFEVAMKVHGLGEGVNRVTLARWLGDHDAPDGGWSMYLSRFTDPLAVNPLHAEYYARPVKETAERRQFIDRCNEARQIAFDASLPIEDVASAAAAIALMADEISRDRERIKIFSAAELANEQFSTEWHIRNVLVKGQTGIIAGPKKALKTNTVLDLCLSLSNKQPFLGKFFCESPANVVFFSGESGAATLKETAERIARSKGMPLASFDRFHISFDLPRLTDPASIVTLRRIQKDWKADVLIIDPVYLAMELDDSASNLFKVGRQLRPLTDICNETGVTILLVHHFGKNAAGYGPPALEHMAWAGFAEFARQWILLNRRAPYDPDNAGFHELWMATGGSAGHSSCWGLDIEEGTPDDEGGRRWNLEVIPAGQAIARVIEGEQEAKQARKNREEETKDNVARNKILAALGERGEAGETKSVLKNTCGVSSARFGRMFEHLLSEESIEPVKVTKNGQTYDGFRMSVGQSDKKLSDPVRPTPGHRSDKGPYIKGPVRPTECLPLSDGNGFCPTDPQADF